MTHGLSVPGLDGVPDVCAVVLRNESGDVLLQLRDEKPGLSASGLWVFPGGHAEPGEDLRQCAAREFSEETGYDCDNLSWLLTIRDSYVGGDPPTHLHIFWDEYRDGAAYECREGRALSFVERSTANALPIPDYLLLIWDLVTVVAERKSLGSPAEASAAWPK